MSRVSVGGVNNLSAALLVGDRQRLPQSPGAAAPGLFSDPLGSIGRGVSSALGGLFGGDPLKRAEETSLLARKVTSSLPQIMDSVSAIGSNPELDARLVSSFERMTAAHTRLAAYNAQAPTTGGAAAAPDVSFHQLVVEKDAAERELIDAAVAATESRVQAVRQYAQSHAVAGIASLLGRSDAAQAVRSFMPKDADQARAFAASVANDIFVAAAQLDNTEATLAKAQFEADARPGDSGARARATELYAEYRRQYAWIDAVVTAWQQRTGERIDAGTTQPPSATDGEAPPPIEGRVRGANDETIDNIQDSVRTLDETGDSRALDEMKQAMAESIVATLRFVTQTIDRTVKRSAEVRERTKLERDSRYYAELDARNDRVQQEARDRAAEAMLARAEQSRADNERRG